MTATEAPKVAARSETAGDGLAMDEAQLREELARLRPLAELGRLAATVAHEVRNPLAGISANAELLREGLADPDDIESLDIILAEVERLSGLVSDLLLYSRERQAECAPMDLAILARRVMDLLIYDAAAEGIDLAVEGSGCAWGDGELSRQALINVVRNGIQASPSGTRITLLVGEGTIHVEDQGCGVPEALVERLFDPFVTGRTRGLGLGAAVARRCLLRQQGDILLESTGNDGSVFLLEWPTEEA
jgi:signal transduction histidine kinase